MSEQDRRTAYRGDGSRIKVADELVVRRYGPGQAARLYINGELFPWGTIDGFHINPRRAETPSVTLTIAALKVEVIDDIGPAVPMPGPEIPR